MASETKSYLGDSVYAEVVGGMVKLTTDNGFGASNTIYLEPEVLVSLDRYRKQIAAEHPELGLGS